MQNTGQPFKTEIPVGHCSHVPLRVLHKDFQVSFSSEERYLEGDTSVSGDLEGMAGLSMLVRGYRLFLLTYITFCVTYIMIVLKRLL
jgi:hypothetical protein